MNKPTFLYRLFGDDGDLLYIGISLSALGRLGEHLSEKSWATQVVRTTIESHPSREDALRAEREAIRTERPRYNVQHNGSKEGSSDAALRGEGTFWRFPLRLRECAAFGMRDGSCPVGLVEAVDDDGCWVALFNFFDGTFGDSWERIEWREIKRLKKADSYGLSEVRKDPDRYNCFLFGDEGPDFRYYETRPLGEFQTRWMFEALPPELRRCACGGRVELVPRAINDHHYLGSRCETCGSEDFSVSQARQEMA